MRSWSAASSSVSASSVRDYTRSSRTETARLPELNTRAGKYLAVLDTLHQELISFLHLTVLQKLQFFIQVRSADGNQPHDDVAVSYKNKQKNRPCLLTEISYSTPFLWIDNFKPIISTMAWYLPFMYFVAEYMHMSAPKARGRCRHKYYHGRSESGPESCIWWFKDEIKA